jgi:hypothetical protein
LKILYQIKSHIRTQWLIPLNIQQDCAYDNESSTTNNQQRLDEWQHVALVLDRLFFLLFVVAMPCTALLFVKAHSSIGNNFHTNFSSIKAQTADAKCDLIYKPILA